MKKTQLYLLALVIAAIGLAAFAYKWKVLRFPIEPVAQTEVWEVQARVEHQARRGTNRVTLQVPSDPPAFSILDETFLARNYGLTVEKTKNGREVQWAVRRGGGEHVLYYRAVVYRDDHAIDPDVTAPAAPKRGVYEEPYLTARTALLEDVRDVTVDSASYAAEVVRRLNSATPSEEASLLLRGNESPEKRAQLARSLLADRQIASRVIHGLLLDEPRASQELKPFLQVWDTETKLWHTVDARTGTIGWPDNFLLWTQSQKPVLQIEGGRRGQLLFSTQRSLATRSKPRSSVSP